MQTQHHNFLTPQRALRAIREFSTRGRVFSVVFQKRTDGQIRHMVCRLHVTKYVKGTGGRLRPQEDSQHGCLTVFEMAGEDSHYKRIPLDQIISITGAPAPKG